MLDEVGQVALGHQSRQEEVVVHDRDGIQGHGLHQRGEQDCPALFQVLLDEIEVDLQGLGPIPGIAGEVAGASVGV